MTIQQRVHSHECQRGDWHSEIPRMITKNPSIQQLYKRSLICWSSQTFRNLQNLHVQHFLAAKGNQENYTHTHPSCLASKGKISSFLWSGYTCASLTYWVSQNAILISDHYFFTLEEGQRNSYCIPLRNILKSYTQQPAGVSRFFSQLFCIANTSSVEAAFPVTHRQLWEGRGEGGGAVERQLCGHLGQQHKGGTRRRKIGGARSQNAQVPKYTKGRTHSKVGC